MNSLDISTGSFSDDWQVCFNDEWVDFKGIKKTVVNGYYHLVLCDSNSKVCQDVYCSIGHVFIDIDGKYKSVDDLNIGDFVSLNHILKEKTYINDDLVCYDLLDVNNELHSYSLVDEDGDVLINTKNCAFITNWEDFSASVLPVLSSGKTSKLVLLSTPNGLNHFYDYYVGAKNETNGFKLFTVKWNEVPNRDDDWKEDILRTLNYNMAKFAQEYCVEFTSTSDGLINSSVLRNIKDELLIEYQNNPYRHNSKVNETCIFKEYEKGKLYIATVDVSRGKGLDYSVMTVFSVGNNADEMNNYEQVAMIRTNELNPQDFAFACLTLAELYNNPYILIETNDLGAMVSSLLYENEYENLICTIKDKGTVKVCFGHKPNREKGIRTTSITKNKGCQILKLLIEQNKLKLNDMNTIDELFNFVSSKNTYNARLGKHDDICMTLVLFGWLLSDNLFIDYTLNENGEMNVNSMYREHDDNYLNEQFFGFIYKNDEGEQSEWHY